MGIFSTNRYNSVGTDVVIEAAEGYHGEIGAAIAMLEGYQNDMALFNGIIATDFQEACLIQEGASVEEVYILQEGALNGAWEKLKEFFIALGKKIKGIFKAFIAKLDATFMKDSKKFYDKYKQDIRIKKDSFKDFSVNCSTLKDGITISNLTPAFKSNDKFIIPSAGATGAGVNGAYEKGLESLKDQISDFDVDTEFSAAVAAHIDGLPEHVTKSTFEKDYFSRIFADKDDVKFTAEQVLDGWVGELLQNKDGLKSIKDTNENTDKAIKYYIDAINKLEKQASDVLRSGKEGKLTIAKTLNTTEKGTADTERDTSRQDTVDASKDSDMLKIKFWQAKYQLAHKKAVVLQDVFNTYAGASVKAYKEACTTARKIFAAAVAYGPKKEDADLVAAIGDSAYYEACELIDNMYYVATE